MTMGTRYERVVERCLSVGDEAVNATQKYVEDILRDLGELSDAMNCSM